MNDEDVFKSLLKLLDSRPDPPTFCLYKALLGHEHQCESHLPSTVPQTNTVLASNTPLQLKKVLSPHNLELDSDTSGGEAWSFSMATPTTVQLGGGDRDGGAPFDASLMTNTDEDSSSEEEGISSGDDSVLRLLGKPKLDHSKTLLKIKERVLMKNKPVARALFPTKGDSYKGSPTVAPQRTPTGSKCTSFDPARVLSPIPSLISPLVHNHQHAKPTCYSRETPLKGTSDLDRSVASVTLFETPTKGGSKDNDETTSCSQELFGSPEMFTPAQRSHQSEQALEEVASKHSRTSVINSDDNDEITDKFSVSSEKQLMCTTFHGEVDHVHPSQNASGVVAGHWDEETPQLLKRFCGEPHLLPHSTPLCSLTQPGPTTSSTSHHGLFSSNTQPVVTGTVEVRDTDHNTPSCSADRPKSSHQPSPLDAEYTPKVPVKCTKEPSPEALCEHPLDLKGEENLVVPKANSKGPSQEKVKKEKMDHPAQPNNYSFGSVGDVMDMLFMSSSQLDVHLSSHKVTAAQCPLITVANESCDTKSTSNLPSVTAVNKSPQSRVTVEENLITTINESPNSKIAVECPSMTTVENQTQNTVDNNSEVDREKTIMIPSSLPQSVSQNSEKQCECDKNIKENECVLGVDGKSLSIEFKKCSETRTDVHVKTTIAEESPSISNNSSTDKLREGLSHSKAKAFHYPSKVRSNLKRKKSSVRTKEYSTTRKSSSQRDIKKSSAGEGCAPGDNELPLEDIVEPPTKRPRMAEVKPCDINHFHKDGGDLVSNHKEAGSDDVTKVEESVIEVCLAEKKEKSPLPPEEMEVQLSATLECRENKVTLLSDAEVTPVDVIEMQSLTKDLLSNEEAENSKVQLPSEKPHKPIRAPGLRRTNKKLLHMCIPAVATEIDSGQDSPKDCLPTVEPGSLDKLDDNVIRECDKSLKTGTEMPLFSGFKTAAGSNIAVSEQSLKKAKQLIGSQLQLEEIDSPEHKQSEVMLSPKPVPMEDSAMSKSVATTSYNTPSVRLNQPDEIKSIKSSLSISNFVTPVSSRVEVTPQPSATTIPRRSGRRTATKPFKAPRKSTDVSHAEEQASVSRILRSFRASGAATDPPANKLSRSRIQKPSVDTGFQTASGAKLTVSRDAMEKAQKLVSEDKENGIAADGVVGSSPLLDSKRMGERIATGFTTTSGKGLSMSSSLTVSRAATITSEREPCSPIHLKTPLSTACPHTDSVGVGFQMASGKSLSVSAKSLLRAKSLLSSDLGNPLEDAESFGVHPHNSMPTGFQTAGGRGISVSSKSLKVAKTLVEEEEEKESLHSFDDIKASLFQSPLRGQKEDSGRLVTGFSTAKGSSISISKALLQKCEKLIEEQMKSDQLNECIDDAIKSDDIPCSLTVEDVETFGAFTQVDFQKQEQTSPHKENLSRAKSPCKTAHTPEASTICNDEKLSLNEHQGLEGTKAEEREGEEEEKEIDDHGCLFSTQVVKQLIDFSSEEEMSCGEDNAVDAMSTAGSQTKKVQGGTSDTKNTVSTVVGDEANVEYAMLAQSERQTTFTEHRGESPLVRNEHSVVVSQQVEAEVEEEAGLLSESMSLAALQELEAEGGRDHHGMDEPTLTVNVSGELTESMLENMEVSINISDFQSNDQTQSEGREGSSSTAAKVCAVNMNVLQGCSEKNVLKSPESTDPSLQQNQPPLVQLQPSSSSSISHFPGLQTASGKHVHISDSALEMAKRTLGSSNSAESHQSFPMNYNCSLQTASGKQVHISESSLAAVRGSLAENSGGAEGRGQASCSCQETRRRCNFPGLQTPSGKKVEVSEHALLAVRKVLGGKITSSNDKSSVLSSVSHDASPVSHDTPSPHPIGLMTARGCKVEISDEALAAVRRSSHSGNTCTRVGLQTASGNKVDISEESMRAAKLLLNSSDAVASNPSTGGCSSESGFPGLFTASGAKVTISEESIEAARAALGDNAPTQITPAQPTSGGERFPGLMTAGGSKVTISEESLLAARSVLGSSTTTAASSSSTSDVIGSNAPSNSSERCSLEAPGHRQPHKNSLMPRPCTSISTTVLPVTTQPSSLPGAPTRKYRPIFRSGGGKTARSQPFAYPVVNSNMSTISPVSVNLGVQQQAPQSRAVVSTPEGTLYDRSHPPGRRPLIPKQSHVQTDSSYVMRNSGVTTSTVPPSCSLPRPPSSVSSQPQSTSSSSLSFKTPHRITPVTVTSSNLFTPSPSPQEHFSRPSTSSVSNGRSFLMTPRRTFSTIPPPLSGFQRNSLSSSSARPAWKGAITPSAHAKQTGHTYKSRLNRSEGHVGQSMKRASNSFIYGPPKGVAAYGKQRTHADDHHEQSPTANCDSVDAIGPFLRTSTQFSSETTCSSSKDHQGSVFDAPLSPLHITLSQVCAMEESQVILTEEGDEREEGKEREGVSVREELPTVELHVTGEVSTTKCLTAAVEDSGYVSREVSSFQSPSPGHLKEMADPSLRHGDTISTKTTPVKDGGCNAIDEDELFAKAALEGLDDSLEEIEDDGDNLAELGSQRLLRQQPKENSQGNLQSEQQVKSQAQSLSDGKSHSVPKSSTRARIHSGVVKPQMGSLLSTRLSHARISLERTVGYKPPGGFSFTQLQSLGISEDTLLVRASNAVRFNFNGAHYFSSAVLSGSPVCIGDGTMLRLSPNGRAGVMEFWDAFRSLSCVDEKLISYEWFLNHYKQVVWKLASTEVCYPRLFGGMSLTPDNLMLQLKYRYDREIDLAERSALHKICENDDVPSKRMVLCVSRVYADKLLRTGGSLDSKSSKLAPRSTDVESGNETVIQTENSKSDTTCVNLPCLVVTDGWYSLPCVLDDPLKEMVKRKKIMVGTKLLVYGAELIGQSNPTHPLEVPATCALKLSANSTRRARWFAKLGYQVQPRPFPVPLMSVFPEGGLVGCTDVVIARVYPMAYLEKKEGQRNVLRSERMEQKIGALHEAERQKKIDSICSRVQKEFEEEIARQDYPPVLRRRSRRLNTLQIKQLQDGEEIYNALNNAPDPQAFQEVLSHTQIILLESFQQSLVSKRQEELQTRIRDAVKEAEDQLPAQRTVVPLLRIRIVPAVGLPWLRGDASSSTDCHLSVWRPTDELRQLLKEGRPLKITNLTAYPSRFKHLQLTATRSTNYEPLKSEEFSSSSLYSPREVTDISQLSRLSVDQLAYRELDTVGIVVCTCSDHVMSHDPEGTERQVDDVYIADSEGCLMVVRFWGGLKSQGLEELVKPGAVLAMSNLSYRGLGHTHNLPTSNAGDSTVFSQKPREHHLKQALSQLHSSLPSRKDRLKFLQALEDEISSYL